METAGSLEAWLLNGQASISLLFVGVILLSYLLEDLAIVTAATLAVDGVMPLPMALLSIFVGISSGDLGLYLLGQAAHKFRPLRYRIFQYKRARAVKRKLAHKAFYSLFIIRFIPGLRTVGFTLSGFVGVPIGQFLLAVLSATSLWTALIFGSFYQLGNIQWLQDSQAIWLMVPLGVLFLWGLNKVMTKTILRGRYDAAR